MKPVILSIALSLAPVTRSAAEEALIWGGEAVREHCDMAEGGAWADYAGGVECLRYFVGGVIDDAPLVIVVLRGDRDRWLNRAPEDIPRNTASAQTALAVSLSADTGFPVIVISRPGTFGASGDHRQRRQAGEFLAIDAALDAIRAEHRISRFVLLGHSGGATAAAALLTLGREDIGCVVLTSGAFGLLERARMLREAAGQPALPALDTTGLPDPYDPLDHLETVVADPARRIILLGNPQDRVAPFSLQERFHHGLQELGHQAELRETEASPPDFHDPTGQAGPRMAAECARNLMP